MLETINDFGRKVTALFQKGQYCTFAPPEETLGVIDTSPDHDGSRGIAFLCDEIRTCFDGSVSRVGYRQVCSVKIIKSYETTFDDELEIEAPSVCIRITDCSLNKFFLRQLINSMCRIYYTMKDTDRLKMHAECTAAAAEHFMGSIPQVTVAVPDITAELPVIQPEPQAEPVNIPDDKIQWLSTAPEQAQGTSSAPPDITTANELPEDMSRDEAMSYLLDSISEINSDSPEVFDDDLTDTAPVEESAQQTAEPLLPQLTEEPESDDIYIKASRRIRLLCNENRLKMEQVEEAVKNNMVTTAEIYSRLSSENEIPPAITERVEILKNATERLSEYFALGEDIAARVMFFMLYQMLSYSDRIVEQPETKEALNDFFRHYGSAGMILSLLDSGI